jgi:hypothetical protein
MYTLSSNIFGSTQMLIGKKQEITDRDFQETQSMKNLLLASDG